MIESETPLPNTFAIAPYYEEAFKEDKSRDVTDLLNHLRELDAMFKS
ncbi:YqcC family protein [Providencia alcalifaciens]